MAALQEAHKAAVLKAKGVKDDVAADGVRDIVGPDMEREASKLLEQ